MKLVVGGAGHGAALNQFVQIRLQAFAEGWVGLSPRDFGGHGFQHGARVVVHLPFGSVVQGQLQVVVLDVAVGVLFVSFVATGG